jgi:hypothetical protein
MLAPKSKGARCLSLEKPKEFVQELLDSMDGPLCQAFDKNGVKAIADLLSLDKQKIHLLDPRPSPR